MSVCECDLLVYSTLSHKIYSSVLLFLLIYCNIFSSIYDSLSNLLIRTNPTPFPFLNGEMHVCITYMLGGGGGERCMWTLLSASLREDTLELHGFDIAITALTSQPAQPDDKPALNPGGLKLKADKGTHASVTEKGTAGICLVGPLRSVPLRDIGEQDSKWLSPRLVAQDPFPAALHNNAVPPSLFFHFYVFRVLSCHFPCCRESVHGSENSCLQLPCMGVSQHHGRH